jgi:major membrane immunogen (membrane-anchored lipoprotein)
MVGVHIPKSGRFPARVSAAVVALAAALSLGAAEPALAAPTVAITNPSSGTVTNESALALTGTTSDGFDQVTVNIYSGDSAEGIPAQTLTASPSGGEWSVKAASLSDGRYTAVAEQTELLIDTGKSSAVSFTIDTVAPAISMEDVSSPTANTPTLEGEAGSAEGDEPAVKVTIYKGTSATGTVAASGSASLNGTAWTYAPGNLADGTYTAQAIQRDAAGNVGRATRTFTVKAAPPAVTLNSVPTPSNDSTPTLKGAAGTAEGDEPAVTVTIYEGDSIGGTVAASGAAEVSGGSWKYTSPRLADGTYTAHATQRDKAGNEGASSPQTFTIDTAAPAVTINTLPSPTSDATPTLQGIAGTMAGDEGVSVTIYAGSAVGGSVASSGTATVSAGAWSYTSSHLNDGTYTAQAVQRDQAGNVGKATTTFSVKAGKPVVTLNQPATPSNNASPTLSGTADTGAGNIQSVTVNLWSGTETSGTPLRTLTADVSGGSWSSGPIALSDGTYTARAEQKDEAGNTGTSAARTFTIDTKPPLVSISPLSSPTNDKTPTLKGARGTATGDIATVSVVVYRGTAVGGSVASSGAASASGGSWTYTSAELPDGTYTAQATQEDDAGNVGTAGPMTFTVKTATPIVTLEALPALSNSSLTFAGSADTGAGDIPSVTVKVYAGSEASGSPVRTLTVAASGGKWSAGPVELSEGTYTAQAEQKDEAGNTGTSAARTFTIDRAPPNVTLSQPASPTNDSTPTLKGTRGTAAKDFPTVSVAVYAGGSTAGTVVASSSFAVGGSAWSYTTPQLPDGTYTAQATQSDEAGNVGKSAAATFTIDTVAPEVTLGAIASPTSNATPKLAGAAGTAEGDSTTVSVKIYQGSEAGGSVAASGSATRSGGTWSFTSPHLSDGTYTAQVTQSDSAGNVGTSAQRTFTVNTAAPTVTMNSPASLSNNATPSFTGTASDTTPVTVKIYKGTTASGSVVASVSAGVSAGSWSSGPTSPALADGTYTAIATEPSSLGNPEGKSAPATFTVAAHAPTVTLNQPASPSNNTTPSFSGTASDTTPVTVRVYDETKKEVAKVTASPSAEAWSSAPVSLAGGSHTYTAVASELSSIPSNGEGRSVPVTFTVDTNPPTVTLNPQAKLRINTATPSFGGSSTDTSGVTVNVYKGKTATGAIVTTASAVPSGGVWTSGPTAAALTDGEYTAQATQPSSIGNQPGASAPSTFVVDTKPPAVSVNPIKGQINTVTPEFSGRVGTELGDVAKVLVKIYKGAAVGTELAAEGEATVASSGKTSSWSYSPLVGALVNGTYTAQAVQVDEAGNKGVSAPATFTIDTIPPEVKLNAPAAHSNNTKPIFTGTASERTPVIVTVYTAATGTTKVGEATAQGTGGAWTSAPVALPISKGQAAYWVSATQTDEAGNSFTTPRAKFTVDTEAPTVTINSIGRTNNRSPAFSGTASDKEAVTVYVYSPGQQPSAGACEKPGSPLATVTATVAAEAWESSAIPRVLIDGNYVAIAAQKSSIQNHCGETSPTPFTIDTVAPRVGIDHPASGSSGGNELTLGGPAEASEGDLPTVTVNLYAGEAIGAGQAPLRVRSFGVSSGRWSGTFAGLLPGTYTARVEQADEAGNVGVSGASVFHVLGTGAVLGSPVASFSWYPAAPHVGESVSLVSSSTDATSPLKSFAWDLTGGGPFQPAGQVLSTTFTTPGKHLVRLRVIDASGASSVAAATIPVGAPQAALIQPFPLVRIVTTHTGSGIRLRVLSILAARGSRIVITCKGHGCPVKKQSTIAAVGKAGLAAVSFQRFQGKLRNGITLEIRVFKPGSIGKYTRLSVRGGSVRRLDECLSADGRKAMTCPTS